MKEIVRNFSECFFGYKLIIGKDELNLKTKEDLWPRIYIERNNNHNSLFFTFPEWFRPINNNEEKTYIYEKAQIGFHPKGYSIDNIVEKMNNYNNKMPGAQKSPELCFNAECILKLGRYNFNTKDCGGVGYISLKKNNKETLLYFATNYGLKKKIYYTIEKDKITLETKNDIDRLKIRVYGNDRRVPCLKDESESTYTDYDVRFEKGVSLIKLENTGAVHDEIIRTGKKFLDIAGETQEDIERNKKMFMLIRKEDKTAPKRSKNIRNLNHKLLCPYCHEEIQMNPGNYKKGSLCNGVAINEVSKEFKLLNPKDKDHTKFMICKNSVVGSGDKKSVVPFRLLPENIHKKRNYSIAVLGKARSGKTAYISRLLNVTGRDKDVMVEPNAHEAFRFYNITSYASDLVARKKQSIQKDCYSIHHTPYYSGGEARDFVKEFINKYIIDFENRKFIMPPVTGEAARTTEFPFILNINNEAYLNIYDIAGEDVEDGSEVLNVITKDENTSILIILDVSKDIEINKNILKNASIALQNYKSTSPIAIVLSKFDKIENEFNSNCACLRSDYTALLTKNLDSSSLIHHIDAASDEIESYFYKKDLDIRNEFFVGFNIKFFSASIVTYSDAIYHKENDNTSLEENGLNFVAKTKRVELPILWILHELGEI